MWRRLRQHSEFQREFGTPGDCSWRTVRSSPEDYHTVVLILRGTALSEAATVERCMAWTVPSSSGESGSLEE
jgi:hypothetical protein